MKHCKPCSLWAVSLAATIMLFAGGLTLAQSPAPTPTAPTKPTATSVASTTPNGVIAPTTPNATDEDIRDIRPPIHIPYGWLWAAYVAGGLALAGLILAAWRWYRHGKSRQRLLYELTLDQLEAVRALMEPLKGYQFSIAVSEIVRNYIEQRFGARAAHRTTMEFLHDLSTESLPELALHQPLLAEFLEHCDMAKFARWNLSMAHMESMHRSACAFVIETGKPAAPIAPDNTPVSVKANPQPTLLESSST